MISSENLLILIDLKNNPLENIKYHFLIVNKNTNKGSLSFSSGKKTTCIINATNHNDEISYRSDENKINTLYTQPINEVISDMFKHDMIKLW